MKVTYSAECPEKHWKKLIELFAKEVQDKEDEVDPDSEDHWQSLMIGWAIAKGLSPAIAREFTIWVRHHTNLG